MGKNVNRALKIVKFLGTFTEYSYICTQNKRIVHMSKYINPFHQGGRGMRDKLRQMDLCTEEYGTAYQYITMGWPGQRLCPFGENCRYKFSYQGGPHAL